MENTSIVITGIGILSPLGIGREIFWKNFQAGQSGIRPFQEMEPMEGSIPFGGEVPGFKPKEYLSPMVYRKMGRASRLCLVASMEAIQDAGLLIDDQNRERIGVVVGTGATDHRVLGGHVVRITQHAQCPVVVWRHPLAKRTGKPLPVIVGIDESEESGRALAEAFDVARALHAPLTVAHMWEIDAAVGMGDLGGLGNMDWSLLEMLESQQRQRMDELVAPLAKQFPNAHVSKVFRDAGPAKGLAELSREAQLVVVGSHGRGRLAAAACAACSRRRSQRCRAGVHGWQRSSASRRS